MTCPRCGTHNRLQARYCDNCAERLAAPDIAAPTAEKLTGPSDSSPKRSGDGWIGELVEAERLAGVAAEEAFQARRALEAAEAEAPADWVTDMTPAERSRWLAMDSARSMVQIAETAERTAQSRYARMLADYDAAMEPPGRPIGDDDEFAFIDQPRSGLRKLHYRPEGLRER